MSNATTAQTWDAFRIEFDEDGTLHNRGRQGFREARCPECGEPIRWVLDMASWEADGDGGFVMCHARCVWRREAFRREAEVAHPDL